MSKKHNLKLIVDNTFSPLQISPIHLGADIVIHSLTKFINGSSDTVGGVYCASQKFIDDTKNVNNGSCMLLGPTMDSFRSASILKNLRTLHIRMKKHSENAMFLAEKFEKDGLKVNYPGLESHRNHELMKSMMHQEYGFGGLLTLVLTAIASYKVFRGSLVALALLTGPVSLFLLYSLLGKISRLVLGASIFYSTSTNIITVVEVVLAILLVLAWTRERKAYL